MKSRCDHDHPDVFDRADFFTALVAQQPPPSSPEKRLNRGEAAIAIVTFSLVGWLGIVAVVEYFW